MRRGALTGARVVLLAGPTLLAFFSGGYFDEPRAWAGLIAWILVVVALIAVPSPLPRARGARLALAALGLLAAWTLISMIWAPLAGGAYHAGQIVALYAGALLAASMLLRERGAQRAVEPALAAGALIVIGYGISERLLPGVLHFQRSISADGRLEQPLTYWNAMGELAAIGLVVCLRMAGDATRSRAIRLLATAAAAPLGMGLYISFSRGALFACLAGTLTLVVVAPTRERWRSGGIALASAVAAAVVSSPFGAVTSLTGSAAGREREGVITLALLALTIVVVTGVQWLIIRAETPQAIGLPRRAPLVAVAVICVGLALAIAVGAKEHSKQPLSRGATRLATLQSNRYSYWSVALRAFSDQPLRGVGAGGWSVYWLRYRPVGEFAQDAHSLPLQTLAELGLVGLALLLSVIGGVAVAARQALRRAPALAAGPIAGAVTYLAHSPLDWDWEMPAVTLTALLLAGLLLALAEPVGAIRAVGDREADDARPSRAMAGQAAPSRDASRG
jgi:hypothetical protein